MKIDHKIRDAFVTTVGNLQSVVKRVTFVVEVSDGSRTESSFFPVVLDDPVVENFVDHDDLTKEQVMKWVMEKVDPDHLKSLEHGLISKITSISETQMPVLVRSSLLDE